MLLLLLTAACKPHGIAGMGRIDLDWTTRADCRGGLNESSDEATPDTCSALGNVLWVAGRVQTRPGYRWVGGAVDSYAQTAVAFVARVEDNSGPVPSYTDPGAGVINLSGLVAARDRWYLGSDTVFRSFWLFHTEPNVNTSFAVLEYWDGSQWVNLPWMETYGDTAPAGYIKSSVGWHIQYVNTFISLCPPSDWDTTTVDGSVKFWVRIQPNGNNLDANTRINMPDTTVTMGPVHGIHVAQYPQRKRYISVIGSLSGWTGVADWKTAVVDSGSPSMAGYVAPNYSNLPKLPASSQPSTFSVVPQFNEAFLAYGNTVMRRTEEPGEAEGGPALVETRDFATGPGAPYDKTLVVQLGEFPRANLISFFAGRLWAAGIADEPFTIRWSAAAPYHKVWPALSYEFLMEDDNSPITAMAPLGEQMVVFKQDSIWIMIPAGENPATGVEHYVPKRVVAGVGCVSHQSVQQIQGRLIFLAEDGLYAFDGTPNIKNLALRAGVNRLSKTIPSIAPGRRAYAAGAHWRTRHLYLLSFATAGAADPGTTGTKHDTTLVYDYDSDSFWLWTGIDAQHWLVDEGVGNNERLYFGDSEGYIFEMGVGQTDHGGTITSFAETHRIGLSDYETRRLRGVRIPASAETQELTVTITADDQGEETGTIDYSSDLEPNWGDIDWGALNPSNWATPRRQAGRLDTLVDAQQVRVRWTHSVKGQRAEVNRIELGLMPLGRR